MADLDDSYIPLLRDALTELHDGAANLYAKHGNQPSCGSLADREVSESPRPESIITAMSIAQLLIEYSSQNLATFVKTLTDPIQPLAACACVRSMLEPCALSAWMTDPTIDHKERVARVFGYRYEGLQQRLKLARVASAASTDQDVLEQRIDDVENTAIALGYLPVCNSKGKRIGIGRRMLGTTEIITQMLEQETMYRILSAVAHGHHWALRQLGFKLVNPTDGAASVAGVDVTCFEKHLFVPVMAYCGHGAAMALAKSLWNWWSYLGWDCTPLSTLLDNVFDQLQPRQSTRFWRSPASSA